MTHNSSEHAHVMPLPTGTRLGGYEIVAAIGAGGPPSLAAAFGRQLRLGIVVAQARS